MAAYLSGTRVRTDVASSLTSSGSRPWRRSDRMYCGRWRRRTKIDYQPNPAFEVALLRGEEVTVSSVFTANPVIAIGNALSHE